MTAFQLSFQFQSGAPTTNVYNTCDKTPHAQTSLLLLVYFPAEVKVLPDGEV